MIALWLMAHEDRDDRALWAFITEVTLYRFISQASTSGSRTVAFEVPTSETVVLSEHRAGQVFRELGGRVFATAQTGSGVTRSVLIPRFVQYEGGAPNAEFSPPRVAYPFPSSAVVIANLGDLEAPRLPDYSASRSATEEHPITLWVTPQTVRFTVEGDEFGTGQGHWSYPLEIASLPPQAPVDPDATWVPFWPRGPIDTRTAIEAIRAAASEEDWVMVAEVVRRSKMPMVTEYAVQLALGHRQYHALSMIAASAI
jgi:hypothetical protein